MRLSRRSALLFLLPALMLFVGFSWYPIARGFVYAFQEIPWNPDQPTEWVGLSNFHSVLGDPAFAIAWRNVAIFVGLGIIIGFPVPIALAIALNELRRGRGFYRLMLYMPTILPLVVVAYLWRMLYRPEIGVIDGLLGLVGLGPVRWLENPSTAMLSLVLMSTWKYAGGTALIYLAALQGIPSQLYEAAEIDGAGFWQRLWHITLPQLRFIMVVMLLLQLIATCQVFTEPFLMTDGGPMTAGNPHGATLTVLLYIYNTAFGGGGGGLGAAAAASVILFVVMVVFSLLYLRLTRRAGAV
ncbi:sugar ABC transporter permease [Candidatus Sumerlaeota bacterium]|nr:sugar ABC transporter permease [Candidatus Sumerlaeota bacterium]